VAGVPDASVRSDGDAPTTPVSTRRVHSVHCVRIKDKRPWIGSGVDIIVIAPSYERYAGWLAKRSPELQQKQCRLFWEKWDISTIPQGFVLKDLGWPPWMTQEMYDELVARQSDLHAICARVEP